MDIFSGQLTLRATFFFFNKSIVKTNLLSLCMVSQAKKILVKDKCVKRSALLALGLAMFLSALISYFALTAPIMLLVLICLLCKNNSSASTDDDRMVGKRCFKNI